MIFDEHDHDELSRLFGDPRWCAGDRNSGGCATHVKGYLGYKPDVREAPNGDAKACPACGGKGGTPGPMGDYFPCRACNGIGRVPNVDAGPAGKRYLHVADKYDPPAWARAYQDRAYAEACRVAEALGVPKAFWPMPSAGALRVLEYPSAGHDFAQPYTDYPCRNCGALCGRIARAGDSVCPALAAGAGTAEHTDFDLFTIVLWRSTPEDLELSARYDSSVRQAASRLSPGLHLGELGELVGLGPATPHRVPARPYVQKSIVYFAIPDHAAVLPDPRNTFTQEHGGIAYIPGPTVGAWLKERMARSRY